MAAHFFRTNERVFNFSHSLGRREYKGLGFRSPIDLTLGKDGLDPAQPKGLMYVISRVDEHSARTLGGVRVVMLTMEEEYVDDFGHFGDGEGGFRWPTALDLDSEGNVYVSDEWLQRLSIFDREGKFLAQWDLSPSNGGEPVRPCGITFDRNDNLYVADRSGHRVQVYTKEGKFLHQFGSQGTGPGQFKHAMEHYD